MSEDSLPGGQHKFWLGDGPMSFRRGVNGELVALVQTQKGDPIEVHATQAAWGVFGSRLVEGLALNAYGLDYAAGHDVVRDVAAAKGGA